MWSDCLKACFQGPNESHKSKIVCTIGPASRSEAVLERLILQGMNVAQLNFARGTLQGYNR
jgi:pyruvate kinase